MDAKERLRRYLEQRRELGESELVLDSLSVDDVMSMLGAKGTQRVATTAPNRPSPSTSAPTSASAPTNAPERPAATSEGESDVVPSQPAQPPAEPPRRFDETSSTDWRETLRRTGVAGESTDAQPVAARSNPAPTLDVAMPAWLSALGLPIGLSAGGTTLRALPDDIAALPSLDAIANMVRACTRCSLYQTAKNPVPGEGNPDADFVCVGEAPGQMEDEQGRPFVGPAGTLLNKILGAIQLQRDDVFICNVMKHRPPGNRDPLPEEVTACEPYLRRQLELVRPRVILALGRFAAQSLLATTLPIGKLRGQLHRYHGIPLIVTYHPAALLRNESWKRPTWEDVQLARRVLDAARGAASA